LKKLLYTLAFLLLSRVCGFSQTTLYFRITNPQIVYTLNDNANGGIGQNCINLKWDVEMKANAANTEYYNIGINLDYNNAALADFYYVPDASGTGLGAGTLGSYYTITQNTNGTSRLNLFITSTQATNSIATNKFMVVPTSYQRVGTFMCRITDQTAAAGIKFKPDLMNGQQYEKVFSPTPGIQNYANPNIYEGADLSNLYIGRIYSAAGWSQYGGSTLNVPYIDWATAVNTSIWEGAATIPTSGSSLASAVRIHSEATLTIPSTGALTATNLENNTVGGVTIQSTSGSNTGSLVTTGTVSGAGTAVVERWMTGDIWHLISPSVTGEDVSTFTAGNSIGHNSSHFALAPYEVSTDNWTYYASPSPLGTFDTHGKGYQILRTTGTPTGNGTAGGDGVVSFSGALAAADVTSPITTGGFKWNLVGNPYPCGLDRAAFIAANTSVIDGSYQFIYVSNVDDKTTYGYTAEASRSVIPPGEGFFIKCVSAGNVSFTTAMKSASPGAFKSAAINFPTINLSAETATDKMKTTVNYMSGMTNGLDPGYDAGLFNGGGLGSFSLSTRLVQDNGVDFQIQCLPDNDYGNMVVPVGLVAASGSAITFKAVALNLPSDLKVVLEDRVANTFTRLDGGGTYSVTLNAASAGPGRFFLRTTTIVSAAPGDLTVELKVVPLPNQQIIQVFGNVNLPARALVYDMNGKLMTAKTLTGIDLNEIPLVNAANGLYLLKIESNKTPLTQKVRWIRN